jgi:hypothetical protein
MKLCEIDGKVADIRPDPGPLIGNKGVEAGYDIGACAERQHIRREMPTHRWVIYLAHRAF